MNTIYMMSTLSPVGWKEMSRSREVCVTSPHDADEVLTFWEDRFTGVWHVDPLKF